MRTQRIIKLSYRASGSFDSHFSKPIRCRISFTSDVAKEMEMYILVAGSAPHSIHLYLHSSRHTRERSIDFKILRTMERCSYGFVRHNISSHQQIIYFLNTLLVHSLSLPNIVPEELCYLMALCTLG